MTYSLLRGPNSKISTTAEAKAPRHDGRLRRIVGNNDVDLLQTENLVSTTRRWSIVYDLSKPNRVSYFRGLSCQIEFTVIEAG